MVRYKRYRGYRRRSTNVIKMKFQSFMDISTSADSMQIITISAGGPEVLRRLSNQFGAYKYYKLGNISVKLVPASTLPVDPTGLSYEAGETTVDPRDQLTPGMMRITNGEDIFENLSTLGDTQQHVIYNTMLLDPRWFKWSLQSGVKRHATPRYWQIGQLHQDKWPGSELNVPMFDSSSGNLIGTATQADYSIGTSAGGVTADKESAIIESSAKGFFQTGHRGRLGWLPTDGLESVRRLNADGGVVDLPLMASPVEVEVMKILLPKAYKTRYFYRAYISETVYFKEPIVNMGVTADLGEGVYGEYRPLDVFHYNSYPHPQMPGGHVIRRDPPDSDTGGNYGDD